METRHKECASKEDKCGAQKCLELGLSLAIQESVQSDKATTFRSLYHHSYPDEYADLYLLYALLYDDTDDTVNRFYAGWDKDKARFITWLEALNYRDSYIVDIPKEYSAKVAFDLFCSGRQGEFLCYISCTSDAWKREVFRGLFNFEDQRAFETFASAFKGSESNDLDVILVYALSGDLRSIEKLQGGDPKEMNFRKKLWAQLYVEFCNFRLNQLIPTELPKGGNEMEQSALALLTEGIECSLDLPMIHRLHVDYVLHDVLTDRDFYEMFVTKLLSYGDYKGAVAYMSWIPKEEQNEVLSRLSMVVTSQQHDFMSYAKQNGFELKTIDYLLSEGSKDSLNKASLWASPKLEPEIAKQIMFCLCKVHIFKPAQNIFNDIPLKAFTSEERSFWTAFFKCTKSTAERVKLCADALKMAIAYSEEASSEEDVSVIRGIIPVIVDLYGEEISN